MVGGNSGQKHLFKTGDSDPVASLYVKNKVWLPVGGKNYSNGLIKIYICR